MVRRVYGGGKRYNGQETGIMSTLDELHGPVTRSIAAMFRTDPFNNIGRMCDIDAKGAAMMADIHDIPTTGRGWAVRGYYEQDGCGCHLYHITHALLPSGMVATFNRTPGSCMHTEMVNLY